MKIPALLLPMLFLLHMLHGRSSPLHFATDTIHINFDTTGAPAAGAFNDYNLSRFFLSVATNNTGSDTIWLAPGSPHEMVPARLAPGATGTIYLYKDHSLSGSSAFACHESQSIVVSFIYKRKKIRHSVWLEVTFGKSALVEITAPVRALDSLVAQRFRSAQAINPALTFDLFRLSLEETLQIRNRCGKALIVPDQAIAYNDWGGQLYYRQHIDQIKPLLPGAAATLPVALNMDRRKHFRVSGYLIVYSPDYSDIAITFTKFSSHYRPAIR